jgi:inosine/xanthosine triphosphatase
MKIRVGSENPVKVEAVKEYFPDFEVESVAVDSGIDEQPKSLEETLRGAQTRAERCKGDADWGIGIESGIMPLNLSGLDWLNIVTCSVWDGEKHCIGVGSGFIVPPKFIDIAFNDGVDLSEAAFRAGFTPKKRIGYEEGIVNILTDGKMARKPYIKQAIMMAMIKVDHPELY